MPVRLKQDQYPPGHWLRERTNHLLGELSRPDAFKLFVDTARENIARVRALEAMPRRGSVDVRLGDARDLRNASVSDASAALTITSPPYVSAQKYIRASELSLGWLSLCAPSDLRALEESTVGREHFRKASYQVVPATGIRPADEQLQRIRGKNALRAHIAATYLLDMQSAIRSIRAATKPGGHVVMITGDGSVAGEPFPTTSYLAEMMTRAGLEPVACVRNEIRSRGLMTTRNRTAGVISHEYVLISRRAAG